MKKYVLGIEQEGRFHWYFLKCNKETALKAFNDAVSFYNDCTVILKIAN